MYVMVHIFMYFICSSEFLFKNMSHVVVHFILSSSQERKYLKIYYKKGIKK